MDVHRQRHPVDGRALSWSHAAALELSHTLADRAYVGAHQSLFTISLKAYQDE